LIVLTSLRLVDITMHWTAVSVQFLRVVNKPLATRKLV